MNIGAVYRLRIRRKRGNPVEYVGTCIGHAGEQHFFLLNDQPGVRLCIDESYILEAAELEETQPSSSP
jgi:hypothetical protein